VLEAPRALEAVERAALAGAIAAPVSATPAGLLYLARCYGLVDLPWLALIPELISFVAVTGALYAAGIAGGAVLARRIHRALTPLASAALGGIAGLAPGAFAGWHFGALDAPWFGGHGLVLAASLGAISIGAAIVRAIEPAVSWRRAILLALAPLPLSGPIAVVAILLGAKGVDWQAIDPLADTIGGAGAGTIVGAIVGLALGVWIGTSAALASRRAKP